MELFKNEAKRKPKHLQVDYMALKLQFKLNLNLPLVAEHFLYANQSFLFTFLEYCPTPSSHLVFSLVHPHLRHNTFQTYEIDTQVTDSAGSATAIVSGVKTNMMVLGIDSVPAPSSCNPKEIEEHSLLTALDWFQEDGRDTGR